MVSPSVAVAAATIASPSSLYHASVSGMSASPSASDVVAPKAGLEWSGHGSKPTMRGSANAHLVYYR